MWTINMNMMTPVQGVHTPGKPLLETVAHKVRAIFASFNVKHLHAVSLPLSLLLHKASEKASRCDLPETYDMILVSKFTLRFNIAISLNMIKCSLYPEQV